jgi:hypothetical protein
MGLLTDSIEKMEGMEMPSLNVVEFFSNHGYTIVLLLVGTIAMAAVLCLLSAPFWKLSKRFVQQENDMSARAATSFVMMAGTFMALSAVYILAQPGMLSSVGAGISTGFSNLIEWLI